jgi:hypothetical protein
MHSTFAVCGVIGLGCAQDAGEHLVRIDLPIPSCSATVQGSGPRDLWCVSVSISATRDVYRHNGEEWALIAQPTLDTGSSLDYVTAGYSSIWLVASSYRAPGPPTVLRIESTGRIEDHSGEFELLSPRATVSIAENKGIVFIGLGSMVYRSLGGNFERVLSSDGTYARPVQVFGPNDVWGCQSVAAGDRLAHFDGVRWTTSDVSCSSSFAASDDGWNYTYEYPEGVSELKHYDGVRWTTATPPPEPDSMLQTIRAGLSAIGSGLVGLYIVSHDPYSGFASFGGRTWDGSSISDLRPFFSLSRNCNGACPPPQLQVMPPLGDGTLVIWAEGSILLGSAQQFLK